MGPRSKSSVAGFALLAVISVTAPPARADIGGDLDKRTHIVNVSAEYIASVNKSGTQNAMDFGDSYRVGVNTYTGKSKNYALELRYDHSSTIFTQKVGKSEAEWVDFRLGYRIYMFQPMIVFGSSLLAMESDDVEMLHTVGMTQGGGLQVRLPVGSVAILKAEFVQLAVPAASDDEGREVAIGPRVDGDFSVVLRLPWQMLDLTAGIRHRSYNVTIDGVQERELETGPYFGFNLGFTP